MNMVFRQVAEHLQLAFGAGAIDGREVTTTLTVLACALTDEGWYAEAIDHELEYFHDWPIITKALRTALGT